MSPNAVASSILTELRAAGAAWRTMFKERFHGYGRAYLIDWSIRPVFDISIAALIYVHGWRDLVGYVVVAMAAQMFLFSSIFFIGEILDNERIRGTLSSLFLTPCRRVSWMAGYAGGAVVETLGRMAIVLGAGVILLDVRLDPNLLALAAVMPLYLLSLSGLGLLLSGIGLIVKRANALSNLVWPFITLIGGVYFPVSELPEPLRTVARALPLGYAMEAITSIMLDRAAVGDVQESVLPLLGFAIASPVIGLLSFSFLDRLVWRRGEIDLY